MERLVACAKARGLRRLDGSVLRSNRNMLSFTESLGFTAHDDPDDPELVGRGARPFAVTPRPRIRSRPRRRKLN